MNTDDTTLQQGSVPQPTPAVSDPADEIILDDQPTQPGVAVSADPTGAPTDQKNPLDVLEELLKDSGGAGADPKAVADQKTEEEKARQMAELEQKMAEQAKIDEQNIAAQQQLMESLKQTPQYQARVQQNEQKEQEKQEEETAGKGFEITQLKHDTV